MIELNPYSRARGILQGLLLGAGLLIGVSACTEKPTLTLAEKTQFVGELIDGRGECERFRKVLAVTAESFQALNEVYEAAKKAYCLKPDV